MRILVIAAHPDDEVLGMGGTIKKYVKQGNNVKIVIMATGITSRRNTNYKNSSQYDSTPNIAKKMDKQVLELKKNAKQAAKILGVTKLELKNFPDNEMDIVSNLEVTKSIEFEIEKFHPEIVFTHSPFDINIDHRILYNSVITATRPGSKYGVKEVISFEVPSSTEWYFPSKFSPNIFVDITKELPSKIKALKAYKNEIRSFPHPRSAEAISHIAKKWGTVSGFKAAEAFSLVRQLRSTI